MEWSRAPVHQIVVALRTALDRLGAQPEPLAIEQWAFSIHGALSAAGREFHNHEHVLELAGPDGDPLDVIAALYHDAVYLQVDQGPPSTMGDELARVLDHQGGTWRIRPPASPAIADVLAVFGREPGDAVTPTTALNELASALVATLHLADALPREPLLAIAMRIEHTIPFRDGSADALYARARQLGVDDARVRVMVREAVRFGNRDVENFAATDPGRFLDNTWKLLPECNPSLHVPTMYTVRDYRSALHGMEGFLASLPAERVFHRWDVEPPAEVHARRVAQAAANVTLAVRYLRAKLYAIAVVEALCLATGGDAPLDYVMGGLTAPGRPAPRRLEQFLPAPPPGPELEPVLHALLAEGRASESSFDTGPSPLASFLHASGGEADIADGVAAARRMWAGELAPLDFLLGRPRGPIAAIARAAAEIVDTRADALRAIAERAEHT